MSTFSDNMSSMISSMREVDISNSSRSHKIMVESGCDVMGILNTMKEDQVDHIYCKFSSAFVKYRQVVAEWMLDVAEYFLLHPTTSHAALSYLDRIQPDEKFSRIEWQMLAISCLLVASKYNECEEHVPSLRKLEEITQQRIPNEAILNYELWALKKMGWKLNARTPIAFLSSYMIVGTVFPDDKCYIIDTLGEKEANKAVESNFRAAAHQCILDLDFKQHNASAIACAIVYFVRQELEFTPVWREELTELTNYDPYVNVNVAELIIMIQKKLRPNRYAVGAFDASNAELLGCRLNSTSSIDEAVFKVESSPLSIADFDKL